MKKTLSNIIYSSAAQLLSIIVPLITAPYISRVLRPANLGIYSYIASVSEVFAVIGSIGLLNYGIREVAYVKEDKKKRSNIFFEITIIKCILLLITFSLYYLFMHDKIYGQYSLVQFSWFLGYFLDVIWFYNAMEDFKTVAIRSCVIKIINIVLIFALVKSPSDLWKYIALLGVSQIIGVLVCYPSLVKMIEWPSLKDLRFKKHIPATLKIAFPQMVSYIYYQMDKIMLEAMLHNTSLIAFYDQADRIVKLPVNIILAVAAVMLPKSSSFFANDDKEGLSKSIAITVRYTLLMTIPMTIGLATVASTFVPWFFGNDYKMVAPIIMALCPIIIARGLSSISNTQYLIPTQNTRYLTYSSVFSAIVNVIVNFLTIPVFGVFGAVLGTIVAEFSVTIIQYYYMTKEIKLDKFVFFTIKYICFSSIAVIPAIVMTNLCEPKFYITIIQVVITVVLYFVLLLISKDDCLNLLYKKN